MEIAQSYSMTVLALGVLAVVMYCQLLVADVIGLRSGHIPGALVPVDHENPLFRATRTVANTNESIAIFILAILFCAMSGAPAAATAYAAWSFVIERILYAVCYYSNLKLLRSSVFVISLVALAALLVIGSSVWL